MKKYKKITGAVPVLHTPITSSGTVDIDGLSKLVDFLAEKNIGGLWVLGTGGEDMNLSFKDRLLVAQRVVEINNGRVPLLMGASFFCLDDIKAFMMEIEPLEVHAIHVMPYHPLFSLERLEWFYKDLAEFSTKPLWMYTSANWCRPIPPTFVGLLKTHENITGIKYSTSNAVQMEKVARLADDDFNVLSAVISTFFSSLCLGVDGGTSSLGGPLAEVMIDLYQKFEAGNHEEALLAQQKLNLFLESWPKGPTSDNFLKSAEEKSLLAYRGLCQKYTTSYYRDCTDGEQRVLERLLQEFYPELSPV